MLGWNWRTEGPQSEAQTLKPPDVSFKPYSERNEGFNVHRLVVPRRPGTAFPSELLCPRSDGSL